MKNNARYSYGYNGTVPCGRLCRGEEIIKVDPYDLSEEIIFSR
jgi:hypothetical protein